MIQTNIIEAARQYQCKKLLLLAASCIYPKKSPQPVQEQALFAGALEETKEWHAIAKIAGIKLCQAYRREYGCDFISVTPTNLYGPGDNFDLNSSHVLPALIRKAHKAKLEQAVSFEIWGSGTPMREFLHVDDLADACAFLLQNYSDEQIINVGYGKGVTISQLAQLVADVADFPGEIELDWSKSDGPPCKLIDSTRLNELGWKPRISLMDGIADTYRAFLAANG